MQDVQKDSSFNKNRQKSNEKAGKVIHIKKDDKMDKSDLYTDLSTLSTEILSKLCLIFMSTKGTDVLLRFNENIQRGEKSRKMY